jgi:hypothetical protein
MCRLPPLPLRSAAGTTTGPVTAPRRRARMVPVVPSESGSRAPPPMVQEVAVGATVAGQAAMVGAATEMQVAEVAGGMGHRLGALVGPVEAGAVPALMPPASAVGNQGERCAVNVFCALRMLCAFCQALPAAADTTSILHSWRIPTSSMLHTCTPHSSPAGTGVGTAPTMARASDELGSFD